MDQAEQKSQAEGMKPETDPAQAGEHEPVASAPEAAEPAPHPDPAQAEIADLKDKLLRSMAEIENLRRRHERDRDEAHKFAVTRFARDLLSVGDNLRRAIDSAPRDEAGEAIKNLLAGVEVTERELLTVFERHQIQRIDALDQKFDPNLHQAMFEVEDPTKPPGTVVQVIAPGYLIAGRLLRAAMVGVSKGGPKEASPVDVKV